MVAQNKNNKKTVADADQSQQVCVYSLELTRDHYVLKATKEKREKRSRVQRRLGWMFVCHKDMESHLACGAKLTMS